MPRVIPAFTQFFAFNSTTSVLEPLVDGWLQFYATQTVSTPKDTYSDILETIPNTNPLQLDSEGRCPDVFGIGGYKVVLYSNDPVDDSPDVVIDTFDPVPGSVDANGVVVSSNDTTPGVLNGKLTAGAGIVLTEVDDAGNESLSVSVTGRVQTTGNETVAGIKTFSSSPVVPTPTTDYQAATKLYADGKISLTGNETVAGIKTFSSSPVVPTPTTDMQSSTKSYVDSNSNIFNLKLAVNAAVNKLDVFTKSGGAVPAATNIIRVAVPDGTGNTIRSRAAAYLSGTSQFILADAANYWSKGSLDAEIKTAFVYAIWDGTGIVWALGGYSGFTRVPTTTTVTEDDYFLLEASSTYTRSNSHYCVCVGKIRYQYDTADTPDHTIQATVLDAPQVIWNPKSDYGYSKSLATTVTSVGDIAEYSAVSLVVKQSGTYDIIGSAFGQDSTSGNVFAFIKVGNPTYASATPKRSAYSGGSGNFGHTTIVVINRVFLNAEDTLHLGAYVVGSGNRYLWGDNDFLGGTSLSFRRVD